MNDRNGPDLRQALMGLQIISLALPLGALIFCGVVLGLHLFDQGRPAVAGSVWLLEVLSMVDAILLLVSLVASALIFRRIFSPAAVAAITSVADLGREEVFNLVQLFQRAHLARLAIMEGAALFGLALIMIAHANGLLRTVPLLWLNLTGLLALLVTALATFPTVARVEGLIEERLRQV